MTKYAKAPPRPPPPSEEQRPDLSMFTKNGTLREPPMVTRLGSGRRNRKTMLEHGRCNEARMRGRALI